MKTKRLPLFVVPLLLIVTNAQAQTPSRSEPPPWKTYTIKGEDFSVALPILPAFHIADEFLERTASNGSVTNIRTVSGLPYGLTEKAIDAARKIKFIPAMKDGKFVSMWMQLEYNFNLY